MTNRNEKLIILSDQLLLRRRLLPHRLANQTQAPSQADSSFCSSAYGILAASSNIETPKTETKEHGEEEKITI